jgi:hypothetical protein
MNTPATHVVKFSPFSNGVLMRRIPHAHGAVHRILRNWSHYSAAHRLLIQDRHSADPLPDSAVVADGLPSAKRFV